MFVRVREGLDLVVPKGGQVQAFSFFQLHFVGRYHGHIRMPEGGREARREGGKEGGRKGEKLKGRTPTCAVRLEERYIKCQRRPSLPPLSLPPSLPPCLAP